MGRIARFRPSPAMVVAFVALLVASAGSATAATLITGKRIKNNSIASADIKNRSLQAKDFRRGLIRRGATGSPGAPGAAGPAGRDGFGVLSYPPGGFDLAAGEADFFVNVCPSGTYPTGGDAYAIDAMDNVVQELDAGLKIADGFSINTTTERPSGWFAEVDNDTGQALTLFVDAICANAATPPPPVSSAKSKAYRKVAAR
jgi:hypothetical protein